MILYLPLGESTVAYKEYSTEEDEKEATYDNFAQAFIDFLMKLVLKYSGSQIFVMAPMYNGSKGFLGNGLYSRAEQANLMKAICERMCVSFIDTHLLSINGANIGSFTSDRLHPNDLGMKILSERVYNTIRYKYIPFRENV